MITASDIGKKVQVSDGTPQPPARFTRKMTEWRHRNYTGKLVKVAPSYSGNGKLEADIESARNNVYVFVHSGVPVERVMLAE